MGNFMSQQPYDVFEFTGAKAMSGTFNNAAAAVGQSADPPFTTDLTDTAHGLLAGSLLYIQGTTNYNGVKNILSLPDANSMIIKSPFVAETLAGTETWKTMVTYDRIVRNSGDLGSDVAAGPPWQFLGFDLTLGVACATAENFTITVDAGKGSAYDNQIYVKAMNTVQYINYMFDELRPMESGDKVDFVWANANSRTWGLKVYARRRA